jgi:hypothetical protein
MEKIMLEELHKGDISAQTLAQLLELITLRITALEQEVKKLRSDFDSHEMYHD